MSKAIKALVLSVVFVSVASPAFAQFGGLGGALSGALSSKMKSAAAVASLPAPDTVVAPKPIEGNSGKYMSPFTSDGVTADWVTKSMSYQASNAVGGAAGAYAGQKIASRMTSMIPGAGLMGGQAQAATQKMVSDATRTALLSAMGGEAHLKESSDLSFNTPGDMAVFMYARYSSHAEYAKILAATKAVYPDFDQAYGPAIQAAPHK
jgi:hypothetical protein